MAVREQFIILPSDGGHCQEQKKLGFLESGQLSCGKLEEGDRKMGN